MVSTKAKESKNVVLARERESVVERRLRSPLREKEREREGEREMIEYKLLNCT